LLGTLKGVYERLWTRASLSIGDLFVEPADGLIYRGHLEKVEGGSGDGASLYEEAAWRGPCRGSSFTGNPG